MNAPATSVKNKLLKGAAWMFAGRVVVNIMAFVSSIILARLLMPEDFGLAAMAISISAIVTSLTAMPLAESVIQSSDVDDELLYSVFTLGLARATALALLLALAAWPVMEFYGQPVLGALMLVLAFNAFLGGFYSPRWPLIQRRLSFAPLAVIGVAFRIAQTIVSLIVAYYTRSVWALVLGIAAGQIVCIFVTYYYAPSRLRLGTSRIREVWSFSVWMTLSSILNALNTRLDTLLVGSLLGSRTVGYYSYGDDKAAMPTREISKPLVGVLFPGLAAVKSDPKRLAAAYRRLQTMTFAACVPAGIGLALVADLFTSVLLGEKWLPIIPIIQILATFLAFEALIASAAPLAMAQGRTRELFHRDVWNFALRLPIILIGLFAFGLPGLLVARAIATVVSILLFMRLVKTMIGTTISDQLRDCRRTFGALAAMAIGVMGFKAIASDLLLPDLVTLLGSVVIGGLCYAAGHLLLWYAAGRPEGPEAEVIAVANNLRGRLRHKA